MTVKKISFASLAAGILLSAILISQAHFHDKLFADTSCVLCLYQANFDGDLDSAPWVATNIALPDYALEIPGFTIPSRPVSPVARSPPVLLVG